MMLDENERPIDADVRAVSAPDACTIPPGYAAKFQRIERLVTLAAEGKIHAVFLAGQAGVSKSTTVLNALTRAGMRDGVDFQVCRGHSSPLGLYSALFAHSGRDTGKPGLLVFDDCDGALRSKDAVNLHKAVLDDKPVRTVSYLSSRLPEGLPSTFNFNGRVIFISNLRLGSAEDQDLEAIRSRCHYAEVYLSQAELRRFIAETIVPQDYLGTSLNDRRYILARFDQATRYSSMRISLRLFRQLLDLFSVDRDNFDLHVSELVPQNEDVRLLRTVLDRNMTVGEACAEYQIVTGKSRRTFFLLKARYREVLE